MITTTPYVAIKMGGYDFHDPSHGLIQHDPLDHAQGMIPDPMLIVGGGQHGSAAGRTIMRSGIITVPVDIVATYGSTQETIERSYRDNLERIRGAITGTQLQTDATYGTGEVRRCTGISQEWIRREELPYGNRWDIPILLMTVWRTTDDIEQEWGALTDPEDITLTNWAGSTSPLTDLEITITGPCDPFTARPLDARTGSVCEWIMSYDVTIPAAETVTLFTDPATARIEASDDDLIDYSAWSHPGNPGYHLEVPTGASGVAPKLRIFGGPAALSISGRNRWNSL